MTTDGSPSRSVTVRLPRARQVASVILVALVGLVLVIGGLQIGSALLRPSAVSRLIAPGGLQEVHVLGGAVYVGRVVGDDDRVLRIAEPATLRQDSGAASSPGTSPRFVVQTLAVDPYDLNGDVLIPLEQVTLIGTVAPGSGLEQAYGQARNGEVQPGPGASPVPSIEPSSAP